MRQINSAGLDLVKEHEGFRAKAYVCPASKLTIGYGHVILKHEAHLKTATLSIAQAEGILKKDIGIAERAVEKYISVELSDNQFAALCSFTFNLGAGNLRKSTLLKKLNANDYGSVPGQLNRWVNGGGRKLKGLVRRRADEGVLFQQAGSEKKCCCPCHNKKG